MGIDKLGGGVYTNCTRTLSTVERGEAMITIDFRDSRPIYEQVRDSLRRLIVSGALPADEKLPSVRELAARLVINPNTIQRAYRELEREGYIVSVPGKGSFARPRAGADSERARELLRIFDDAAEELMYLGLTASDLKSRLDGKEAKADEN